MQITALNEKAMLVKLTVKKMTTTKRDANAEQFLQSETGDEAFTAFKTLFKSKDNPVNRALADVSAVYTLHKKLTLPYVDKGPRILVNDQYESYTKSMRDEFNHVDKVVDECVFNWDAYVQQDIDYRVRVAKASGRPAPIITAAEYPTAQEFKERTRFILRFFPLPEKAHFLFDISEEDKQAFEDAMNDAAKLAKADAVNRMLTPLTHLVSKLTKPIGAEGAIFRDSAIENVIEGLEEARKLIIDPTPEVKQTLDELDAYISKFATNSDVLRESPVVRMQAQAKLKEVEDKMAFFMGA